MCCETSNRIRHLHNHQRRKQGKAIFCMNKILFFYAETGFFVYHRFLQLICHFSLSTGGLQIFRYKSKWKFENEL